MIKKLFIVLFLSFFIFSCSEDEATKVSSSTWSTTKSTLADFSWENFTVKVPSSWDIVSRNKNAIPEPKTWKVELVATSKDIKNEFANSFVVLSTDLKEVTSSVEYSQINSSSGIDEYYSYRLISSSEFQFFDSEKSKIFVFNAKYNETTPTLKFLQVAHICNRNKAYLLTIALLPEVTDIAKYENILKTFSCK